MRDLSTASLNRSIAFWWFMLSLVLSVWAGRHAPIVQVVERTALDETLVAERGEQGFRPVSASALWAFDGSVPLDESNGFEEWVESGSGSFYKLVLREHRGIWSLFPAFVTIVLCFITREPLTSLGGGLITGSMVLAAYDITGDVLIPALASSSAALVVVLYLVMLGGLLGIWSRNGAAVAFAEWVTRTFVRGPRTAKLAAWALGAFFFQGGTISTLLVGTTIKPVADAEKISHEELSYIVDSTASPIAILLPFNAWPFYVQALIFVAGVPALATEASRVQFFFGAIPLYFYAAFAVLFTFLLSVDRLPFISRPFREAIVRARTTGELNRPGARPMQKEEETLVHVPEGYRASPWEFVVPLVLIIGIAIGTFVALNSPNVMWAFGIALLAAYFSSRARGMAMSDLVEGFTHGIQSVSYGAVVLLLAVVIGTVSRQTGGGLFLIDWLGEAVHPAAVPVMFFVLSLLIAFATGTSWGTFAVTLPLTMPLAWEIAGQYGVSHPMLFLQISFAAVINGSVFGDQCSPISDTTVLSSLATGCDLMDHVRTQIVPCMLAGTLAVIGWTLLVIFAV